MPFFLNPSSPFFDGGGQIAGLAALALVLVAAWRPHPQTKLMGLCAACLSVGLVAVPAAPNFPILYSLILASLAGVIALQARAQQATE